MGLILLIILILLVIGGLPQVPIWNHGYGYAPSGLLFVILIIVLIFVLAGRL